MKRTYTHIKVDAVRETASECVIFHFSTYGLFILVLLTWSSTKRVEFLFYIMQLSNDNLVFVTCK